MIAQDFKFTHATDRPETENRVISQQAKLLAASVPSPSTDRTTWFAHARVSTLPFSNPVNTAGGMPRLKTCRCCERSKHLVTRTLLDYGEVFAGGRRCQRGKNRQRFEGCLLLLELDVKTSIPENGGTESLQNNENLLDTFANTTDLPK
jgi:hypothetical protein